MGARDELMRRIERKEAELKQIEQEAQAKVREGRAYIQALQEALRLLPREGKVGRTSERALRPNSMLAKARDAIKKAGRPLHVSEILTALGKPVERASRSNLSGTIGAYVRKGEIFIKTAPNTFSLAELEDGEGDAREQKPDDESEHDQAPQLHMTALNGQRHVP